MAEAHDQKFKIGLYEIPAALGTSSRMILDSLERKHQATYLLATFEGAFFDRRFTEFFMDAMCMRIKNEGKNPADLPTETLFLGDAVYAILRRRVFYDIPKKSRDAWGGVCAPRDPSYPRLEKHLEFRRESDVFRLDERISMQGLEFAPVDQQVRVAKKLSGALALFTMKLEPRGAPEIVTKQQLLDTVSRLGKGATIQQVALRLGRKYETVRKALKRHKIDLEAPE